MIGLEGTLVYCKGVASSASARAGEAHERRGAALLMYFSGFPAHFLRIFDGGGGRGGVSTEIGRERPRAIFV